MATRETLALEFEEHVYVDGVSLREYLEIRERMDTLSRAMVANTIAAFGLDGRSRIGSRTAALIEHGTCYRRYAGEWSCAHRPFKERRRIARSRRNTRAREDAFRVVERNYRSAWELLKEDIAALEQDWMEIEAEPWEAKEERWSLDCRASELLITGEDDPDWDRHWDEYDASGREPDEDGWDGLDDWSDPEDWPEDDPDGWDLPPDAYLKNERVARVRESFHAYDEERDGQMYADALDVVVSEYSRRIARGDVAVRENDVEQAKAQRHRMSAYNNAIRTRAIERFDSIRQISSRVAVTIESGTEPHEGRRRSREGMRPFKERPSGFARSRRLAAAKERLEAIFEDDDAEGVANA